MASITRVSTTAPPPTIVDVRAGLQRSLGADFDSTWASVCTAAGLPTDAVAAPDDRLDDLLTAVSSHSRLCHVLAMSWRIRCTAARKLAEIGR